ncbi:unnamed protein product [Bursaphelenchus okinawaensis]|uniref:Peptidase M13 C-terminal domain-containing protein n=1 Tax=Bursaphelenchus okinawaensis TaxID=465554 RepID=A0A811JT06_9BILA|nr:unnamed protein product [Bursaphelenchus okinawaensis]CAG9081184.1 unnamed protein product [Bursaphelenchus okinawaensis]
MYVPSEAVGSDCLSYIQYAYPLYLHKMIYDHLKEDQSWYQRFHDNYFLYANVIMQQAEEMLKFSNVLDQDDKQVALRNVLLNKFAFFNHSFYEDDNFREYAGEVTDINPLSSVFVSNLKPLIRFNYDKDEKLWIIPQVRVNALHLTDTHANFFDWGIFLFDAYDKDFSPLLTLSSCGFAMSHELAHTLGTELKGVSGVYKHNIDCLVDFYANQCDPISLLCLNPVATLEENLADTVGARLAYDTYKKWVSIKGHGPRPRGPLLDTFSDDQLFFINFAQNFLETIDWQAYDPDHPTHPPTS